jgi:hypothetical protein
MKKLVQLFIISSSLICSNAFAGSPAEDKAKNNSSYNSPDEKVKFNAEKSKGEVKLQVELADFKGYDHIVIEKSSSLLGEFTEFKTILMADQMKAGGSSSIQQGDKSSSKDVFYRVKTVTKDGIARMYAPLMVPAESK